MQFNADLGKYAITMAITLALLSGHNSQVRFALRKQSVGLRSRRLEVRVLSGIFGVSFSPVLGGWPFSLRQRALRCVLANRVASYVNSFARRIGPFSVQIPADCDVL